MGAEVEYFGKASSLFNMYISVAKKLKCIRTQNLNKITIWFKSSELLN